jgi:hypothetical protein
MQAIRTIQTPTSGVLTIQIPEGFINREVEIIILLPEQFSQKEETSEDQVAEEPERYIIAQQFKGKARFPDYPTNKYDVYEQ